MTEMIPGNITGDCFWYGRLPRTMLKNYFRPHFRKAYDQEDFRFCRNYFVVSH
jgi:hypothetical protein